MDSGSSISSHIRGSVIGLMFKQLRPKQWTKNLLVFAAFVFSIGTASIETFINSIIGFLLFCFVSGCVYILNDFIDREADRLHPVKKYRPMASGQLNPYLAISVGLVILLSSLIIAFYLNVLFGVVLAAYFLLNVAYSIQLKHVVIIDIMIIAGGFVLRAIGGGLVINVRITPWFLICTLLLALFLAINKRRHELLLLESDKGSHRKVLQFYSPELIDQLSTIVTASTLLSYMLFTFTSGHTIYLMWTIPFVVYGMFRYLYLIQIEGKGGSPDRVLLEDKHILVTVAAYAVLVIVLLVYFD